MENVLPVANHDCLFTQGVGDTELHVPSAASAIAGPDLLSEQDQHVGPSDIAFVLNGAETL